MQIRGPKTADAAVIAVIVGNCGSAARSILASARPRLTAKKVAELSRTSPEYQAHVLARIQEGHATPLKKTAACAYVYETTSFAEILSRMQRALGAIRMETAFMDTKLKSGSATT